MSQTPLTNEEIAELNRLSTLVDDEDHYRLLDVGRSSEAMLYNRHTTNFLDNGIQTHFFRRDVGEYGPLNRQDLYGTHRCLSGPERSQKETDL